MTQDTRAPGAPTPPAPKCAGSTAARMVAADLSRAAEVIERNGWHQGDFLDYQMAAEKEPNLRAVPVCAVGAIRIAADQDPDNCGSYVQAVEAFADWLATTGQIHCDADPVEVIGRWNDDSARNAPQVIAALRQAAVEAVMPS